MPENIRIIHVITRLDMGGSAQEALFTAMNLDPQCYKVTLVKGSTLESAMTSTELHEINQQLDAACNRDVNIINFPSLIRRISPWNDFKSCSHSYIKGRFSRPTSSLASSRSGTHSQTTWACVLWAF
jgi:hypothetical protein